VSERARLRALAAELSQTLGIKFPDVKLPMLRGRLERRMRVVGADSLEAYEARLDEPAERAAFLDLATTNKTDFFREPEHFAYLREHVLPALPGRCRIWSAGCSSGQEVYTLAMVLAEHARTHPGFDFEVIGTDISTRVLAAAKAAIYPEELAEPIAPDLRKRYLLRGTGARAGTVRIARELRAKVRFGRLNFMAPEYPVGEVDIVFFRNVMIYFDVPTIETGVGRMCRQIRPNGHLFIGHCESLSGLPLPLAPLGASIFRRLP